MGRPSRTKTRKAESEEYEYQQTQSRKKQRREGQTPPPSTTTPPTPKSASKSPKGRQQSRSAGAKESSSRVNSSSPPEKSPTKVTCTEPEMLSLGQKLYNRREHDALADLTFVTDHATGNCMKAHIIVVREASSTLEEMINKRLRAKVQENEAIKINLPSDVGLDSVNLFLTYIYTNNFGSVSIKDANFSMETLLQLLTLANHFGVNDLYSVCCALTKKRLNTGNCVEIFETLLPLSENPVCEEAFQLLLKNVDKFIASEEFLDWHWVTWRSLFIRGEKIVALFKALKKWKDHDFSGRDEVFKRLVKCIGFRSFGAEAVVDTLEGTGILTQSEMVDLFVHFTGGQRIIDVSSDTDLQSALDTAAPGSSIRLNKGTFKGNFSITKNSIKLIGEGNKTIIKGRLVVDANLCEISELKIVSGPPSPSKSNRSALVSTSSSSSSTAANALVIIKGDGNMFNNSTITWDNQHDSHHHDDLGDVCALSCTGNENKLVGILSNISSIRVCGDKNTVEAITFSKVEHGIVVEGDDNTVSDVLYFPAAKPVELAAGNGNNHHHHHQHYGRFSAVNIYDGKGNIVVNLRYVQVPASLSDDDELMFMLSLGSASKSTRVRNCFSGPVLIDGESNEVINVKTRPRFHFKVLGKKHQLVNCGGEKVAMLGRDVVMTDCLFY